MVSMKIEHVRMVLVEVSRLVGDGEREMIAACCRELERARNGASVMEAGLTLLLGRVEGEVLQ